MYETKDPAVLFYTRDFLVGVMTMSDEQVGKYIKLLCLQHQKGHLKETEMLQVCGGIDETVFLKFTVDENGLYYNERMEYEINRRLCVTNAHREAGKKGGKKPNENQMVNQMVNQMETNRLTKAEPNGEPNKNQIANANANANANTNANEAETLSNKKPKKKFLPPTVEEVSEYCKERGNGIDANHFVDYYAVNEWKKKDGTPITNWKQCVLTWEQREKENGRKPVYSNSQTGSSKKQWNLQTC